MPALRELQERFHACITDGGAAEDRLLECLVEQGEPGRRRIAAYRSSILGNLVGALHATYPVVARIVGLPFFRQMARVYVAAHPSASGDLNEYGGAFPDFVAAWPHAASLGYLPDVARLEWAVQQVYYAPDAEADLSTLAACPPEDCGELRFVTAPAHARLDSPWPLADIWRVNADGYAGNMAVDFSRSARLLVLRQAGRVRVEALSEGEAELLDGLAAGSRLASAAAAAFSAQAGFDLGAALARFVAAGILVRAFLAEPGTPSTKESQP